MFGWFLWCASSWYEVIIIIIIIIIILVWLIKFGRVKTKLNYLFNTNFFWTLDPKFVIAMKEISHLCLWKRKNRHRGSKFEKHLKLKFRFNWLQTKKNQAGVSNFCSFWSLKHKLLTPTFFCSISKALNLLQKACFARAIFKMSKWRERDQNGERRYIKC